MRVVEVDVLIVGAGPAGASLACFLAYHGITGLMISKEKHTALQPRAHMMNMATWECLRDIGLEQEYRQISMGKEYYGDYRYCTSLNGADIVRMRSFGCEPQRLVSCLRPITWLELTYIPRATTTMPALATMATSLSILASRCFTGMRRHTASRAVSRPTSCSTAKTNPPA